jgi:cytochrome c-type biogenesis protein CcmH
LLLPIGAMGLYLRIGSPESAAHQAATRGDGLQARQSIESMVVQVEAHLATKPGDGRAWEVLAPVYLRLGRYEDSVNAWQNTLAILGENADREESLGESLVALASGVVTADAKAAFEKALSIDRMAVAARYYLGLAAEQDGRREDALNILRDLIASAPVGAHWVGSVREALARLEGGQGDDRSSGKPDPSSPSAAQMQAAAKLAPEQQNAMIRGMVDRLAARLKSNGDDPEGWIRLVRSYDVLGEGDNAAAAIADAQRALAPDRAKLARFEQALQSERPATDRIRPGAAEDRTAPPPEEQKAIIHRMVERLAARLEQNGDDLDGWLRLMRSYSVLGEQEKAREAAAHARKAMVNDPERLRRLEDGARDLNIPPP